MQRVLKKHLTPLSKKGTIQTQNGKGASEMPLRSGTSMNDYAKATPMASPAPLMPPPPTDPFGD